MANVIVFGGELNWWWRERRKAVPAAPLPLAGSEEPPPA
jgi:hypothetical protein